ncbi:metal ABC transporter substrate-binding protein [Pseudaestuariivita sp.]|uniref:metal ABC transporter substrate-binding protein n=1 Tax=Pseudaestuariivita sp. TaxID=2211669 RepID=UPI004058190E
MRKLTPLPRLRGLCAAALLALAATSASAEDRPRVVAVSQALASFAEALLGDAAQVEFPVPDGVDPSFWRPSIADISAVQSADMILLNGAGFATWIDRVSLPRSRVVNTSAGIEDRFIVTESITHSHGDGGEHSHEGLAAYTWLDPTLARAQVEVMATALERRGLAPDDADARLADLRAALTTLDTETRNALQGMSDTTFIATHPRYQYLARRYDLSIAALEWEAGAMPNADELAALEALVEETGARVLIWEAAPPAEAIDAASALGLASVVFEPWAARTASEGTFVDAYAAAVAALSEAARQAIK